MIRKLIFLFVIVCLKYQAQAQANYAVDLIPPELLKDANAVFREDYATFEIIAKDEAIYKVRQVITILH